ncbi:MAG TPA: PqqD family protein [Niabella sp.]|nr:PqqD family protein [Niabella sp.]HOZ98056.1 PqqD family protein [Niabella sp.]HQW14799.1 PqqD family protein [Niabella sp.]HQX18576.1 PqqD family protein [Niabella sp.]HQX40796.1 PqqD family protein [Niabella sp.]
MNYQLNTSDILITQLGEEGVAFNSVTNEYFTLNETSFKILKGIEKDLSVKDICVSLSAEYDITEADCETSVNNTIQLFLSKKLIVQQ